MTSQCTAATSRRTQQARNCAFAIAAMAAFLSTPATAEPSYYGGVNFAVLEHEVSSGSDTEDNITVSIDDTSLNYTALVARLGVQFHENLSVEARLGFGIGDDKSDADVTSGGSTSTLSFDAKIDNFYGGYFRAGMPIEQFYPYVLAGWTEVEFELEVGGATASNGESDFSYGIGTDIHVSDNASINLEWTKYYDKGNSEISGFSIGIVTSF